jgi:hypothetical protein
MYSSPNIIQMIKMRKMRFAGHVPSIGKWRVAYRGFWGGNLRQRDHLVDPVVDGRIILRWSLRNCGWGHGLD